MQFNQGSLTFQTSSQDQDVLNFETYDMVYVESVYHTFSPVFMIIVWTFQPLRATEHFVV